jgi:MFS family permease
LIAGHRSPFVLIAGFTAFGTVALPLYSLVLAHANDHIGRDQILGASAKLVMLYGLGALAGPSIAGELMDRFGPQGYLLYLIAVYGVIAGFAFLRRLRKPEDIKAKAEEVLMAGPHTTPVTARALAEGGEGGR